MKHKKGIIMIMIFVIVLLLIEVILLSVFLVKKNRKEKYQDHMSLGDKYLEEQDFETAEFYYLEALEIERKNVDTYLQLAEVYVELDDIDAAYDILEEAREFVLRDDWDLIDKKEDSIQDMVEEIQWTSFLNQLRTDYGVLPADCMDYSVPDGDTLHEMSGLVCAEPFSLQNKEYAWAVFVENTEVITNALVLRIYEKTDIYRLVDEIAFGKGYYYFAGGYNADEFTILFARSYDDRTEFVFHSEGFGWEDFYKESEIVSFDGNSLTSDWNIGYDMVTTFEQIMVNDQVVGEWYDGRVEVGTYADPNEAYRSLLREHDLEEEDFSESREDGYICYLATKSEDLMFDGRATYKGFYQIG